MYNPPLQFIDVINLQVLHILVNRSIGEGLSATNVLGQSVIRDSRFLRNNGNAPHMYIEYGKHTSPLQHNILSIKDTVFRHGVGGSISIQFEGPDYPIAVEMRNITTNGSSAKGTTGGDIEILLQHTANDSTATVSIIDSSIESSMGTGIYISPKRDIPSSKTAANGKFFIGGSNITGHLQGGVHFFNPAPLVYSMELTIEDSAICKNILRSGQEVLRQGAGLTLLYGPGGTDVNQTPVILKNVLFEDNNHTELIPLGTLPTTVYSAYAQNVTVSDSNFHRNQGTPIRLYDSSLTLSGSTHFTDNSAYQGGALALYGNSHVNILNNSHVDFATNYAEHVGGAIFVDTTVRYVPLFLLNVLNQAPECFLQLPDIHSPLQLQTLNVSLSFINNRAQNGGDAIYGDLLDECSVAPSVSGFDILLNNFTYILESNSSKLTPISSDPWRVCLCRPDGKPDCTKVFSSETCYPGETFNISAIVVGQRFGSTSGSVYANFLQSETSTTAKLGEFWQRTQSTVLDKCTELTYSILSEHKKEVLTLTAVEETVLEYLSKQLYKEALDEYRYSRMISREFLSFPVYINVTLLPCPLGFRLSGNPPRCECDKQLQQNHLTCNISDQTVMRHGTVWVNASFHDNSSDAVIVYKYCPFYYCKPEVVNVNLKHPDTQCAFNRSGILCGACQPGYSLALGSPKCLKSCSNSYLALLVPFALAGIALVFFIKLLNLTVAVGTINGLVFYANVVRANWFVFFPAAGEKNVLTVFIAWLNLDLGVETCFFHGLEGYDKTWLQFVFPLYIWAIAAVIITLSHYSSKIAQVIGSNSVPILTTLFLLSYAKLLRTVIAALSITFLEVPNGSKTAVWFYDGNVDYLGALHLPLFIVAIVFLVFLCLPYTVILLFAQCLQRTGSYRVTKWIAKFKPFFDSYWGPFKDQHRYWAGALLLVRGILLLTFALNPTNERNVNLLAVTVIALVLLMYSAVVGQIYKSKYLTVLESSFFLNLGILAAGTFYVQQTSGNQYVLVYTSVGIAFIQFAGIVIFHSYATFRKMDAWLRNRMKRGDVSRQDLPPEPVENSDTDESSGGIVYRPAETEEWSKGGFFSSHGFSELREPLLEDCTD